MLVSFSVKNYRSFAEKQTLSLVAGTAASRKPQYAFETSNTFAPHLLRSACLFGANGSGKSSFIKAMRFFQKFVVISTENQLGDEIPVKPYLLHSDFSEQPSEFEIIFINDTGLYQYGFSVDKERVRSEWLFSKPSTKKTAMRKLFQREYDEVTKKYKWDINNTFIKGEKTSWKNQTTDNVLFLSRAVQLNAEDLKEPFSWIRNHFTIIQSPDRMSQRFTSKQCLGLESKKEKTVSLLRSVGLNIESIKIERKDLDVKFPDKIPEELKKIFSENYEVKTCYVSSNGKKVYLNLGNDESDGTNVLFCISSILFDALENGHALIIDELHNSLHPHALKVIIDLFNNPKVNKNNAQLIFASHETSIMAKGFMHKDQIWFTENQYNQGTQLTPLSDYQVQDKTNLQKNYLNGRYGGIPMLRDFPDVE